MAFVKGFSKFFAKGNTTPQLLEKLANCVEYKRVRGHNRAMEEQAEAMLEVIADRSRSRDPETLASIAALPVTAHRVHNPVAAACLELWDRLAPPAGLPPLSEYVEKLSEIAKSPLTNEDLNELRRFLEETR